MSRYALAFLLAAALHALAFWGWHALHDNLPAADRLPQLDLSSVTLSLSDAAPDEAIADSAPPSIPPAAPPPTPPPPAFPPADTPSTPRPNAVPPDAVLAPDGLPLPVAEPPPDAPRATPASPRTETRHAPAATPTTPARDTAQIDAPPAPPSDFRPRYPHTSRQRGEEGTVLLEIEVAPDGRPTRVVLRRSSGHVALDAAARRAAQHARFTPAIREGVPAPGRLTLPIIFRLR